MKSNVQFFLLLILALAISTSMQAQNILYVKKNDGSQSSYLLSGVRKLTFPTGAVVVSTNSATPQNDTLKTVRYLSFTDYKTVIPVTPTESSLLETIAVDNIGVYPSPAIDELTISYQSAEQGTALIRIVDMQGQAIMEQTHQNAPGENSITLNISHLAAGLYTVSNGLQSNEFIKK